MKGRQSFVKLFIYNNLEESPERGTEFYRKILQPLAFSSSSLNQAGGAMALDTESLAARAEFFVPSGAAMSGDVNSQFQAAPDA